MAEGQTTEAELIDRLTSYVDLWVDRVLVYGSEEAAIRALQTQWPASELKWEGFSRG